MSMEGGLIQPHHGMEDSALQMDTEPSADDEDKMVKEPDASGEFVACDEGGADLEPYEGMEFESEEAARTFYGMYATRLGFRTRISRYTRSRRDNSIISRRIVCSKEGFREDRPMQGLIIGGEPRQRHRAVTRVGCKAMITVKKTSTGKWAITKFVKEHNHGPVPPRKVEVRIVREEEKEDDALIERSLVSPGVDVVQEPYEGMEFDSEEAAKSYYSTYALHMGFRARISKYCRSRRDNSIISRQIVCSKEGFREIRAKEMTDEGKLKRPRVVTRIGCKAMIIVKKLNSGKWAVSKFDREHNHALVPPKKVSLLRSDSTTGEGSITNLQGASSVPSGVATGGCYAGIQETSQESLAVLYKQLYCEAIKYAQEGAATVESYNMAMSALREAVEKVAAAKRGAVTGGAATNQGVTIGQGTNNLMIPAAKALRDLKGSNYTKQAIATQEFMLLQQPISFVLIPSTSPNDSDHAKQPVDAPVILNVTTNGQMVRNPTDSMNTVCSSQEMNMEQPLTATPSVEGFVGSDLPAGRKGRMHKTDADTKNHAVQKSKVKSSSSIISPGFTEAQIVAIPALPVSLYMPVMGSLPETRSVTTPGSIYTLVPAPFEAGPVSAHPMEAGAQSDQVPVEASQSGPSTSAAAPSDETKPYTGCSPNPRVHATAIAAGARIVPPNAAASVINAIEARIRSARVSLAQTASPSGCQVSAWIPQPCDGGEGERVPRGSQGHKGGAQVPNSEDAGLCTSKEFDASGSMTMIPRGRELVDTPGGC